MLARRTRPTVGRSKPAIIRSVLVFPLPLGPSSAKNSPSGTTRSSSLTATSPPGYIFVTDASSTTPLPLGARSASVGVLSAGKLFIMTSLNFRLLASPHFPLKEPLVVTKHANTGGNKASTCSHPVCANRFSLRSRHLSLHLAKFCVIRFSCIRRILEDGADCAHHSLGCLVLKDVSAD